MNALTIIFLVALGSSIALQFWLGRRQIAHIGAHRDEVPTEFRDDIPIKDHRKAADYTQAKTRLNLWSIAYQSLILLAWTIGGGLDALDGIWRGFDITPLLEGTGFIVSALIISDFLGIPFTLYATFGLEQRFGFNRMTPATFISDFLKSLVIVLVIATPLTALVLWLMSAAGPLWWVYAWGVFAAFSFASLILYPTLIAPLFNKFKPLSDVDLKKRIDALAEKCGFVFKDIFVMDGSKRSSHGNAYFTGLGAKKRIVFFDTLIETLEGDEIEAVLAHELGHYKRRHVQKMLAASLSLSFIGFLILGWLTGESWFYSGLGVTVASDPAALMLFAFVSPVFLFFLRPVVSGISRRFEYQADDFAATYSSGAALVRALVKLYRDNASTLTPDPVYSVFYHSHPPPPMRVAHIQTHNS